jgi:hypothetical protein
MSALFLRHEGFLGAVGAFLKVHPMQLPTGAGRRVLGRGGASDDGSAAAGRGVLSSGAASTKARVCVCVFFCVCVCLYLCVCLCG